MRSHHFRVLKCQWTATIPYPKDYTIPYSYRILPVLTDQKWFWLLNFLFGKCIRLRITPKLHSVEDFVLYADSIRNSIHDIRLKIINIWSWGVLSHSVSFWIKWFNLIADRRFHNEFFAHVLLEWTLNGAQKSFTNQISPAALAKGPWWWMFKNLSTIKREQKPINIRLMHCAIDGRTCCSISNFIKTLVFGWRNADEAAIR